MRLFKRKSKNIDLTALENQLTASLRPVVPRQEFVNDLRSRLMAHIPQSASDLVVKRAAVVPRGWIVAGGVAGSLLMLIVSIRGLLSIAGIARLLIGHYRQGKSTPVSQPAH